MSGLAVELVGDSLDDSPHRATALFLHGILGSKNNWKGFCRRACDAVDGLRCAVVDLRGHGRSHGLSPPHTIEACVDDVMALGLSPGVVVGHSFGGKVALALAERRPPGVQTVVALDVPPGTRDVTSDSTEVGAVIRAVRAVRMPIASRRDLVEVLRAQGLAEPLCQWMTTNLVAQGDALRWAFDLAVIEPLLGSFAALDLWPTLEQHRAPPEVHVVRAGRGARFSDEDQRRLDGLANAGHVHVHLMPDAGHWLHTDDPVGLLRILTPLLRAAVGVSITA